MEMILGFLLSASIIGGLIIGFEICYDINIVYKNGMDLIKHPREHFMDWMDLTTSIVLLWFAFTTPSIALPLSIANLIVRIYIRTIVDDDGVLAQVGHWCSERLRAIVEWIADWSKEVKTSYDYGKSKARQRKARKTAKATA